MILRLALILGLLLQSMQAISFGPCTDARTCCAAPTPAAASDSPSCCGADGACCCTQSNQPPAPKPAPPAHTDLKPLLVLLPSPVATVMTADVGTALAPAAPSPQRLTGAARRPLLCIWLT